jgi:hypothetical protein
MNKIDTILKPMFGKNFHLTVNDTKTVKRNIERSIILAKKYDKEEFNGCRWKR